ncbi:MAG: hypothetical protein HON68_09360 [Gammaproteobacteria bacterium]|nr:hypothetical protein [Gammaproteobacteria bacterium]MBT3489991.1 hypothetical protein [Gammaproteobacteria bacterium]MBT3718420.1 hypothetical protein [Gammaproteobacteria bacterium]MBT3845896.1 hypothetical protein [Gammaproteobacteria bacterium]MBT3893914.1 hypothetical protein [Gammaproteobacteria bacterium]
MTGSVIAGGIDDLKTFTKDQVVNRVEISANQIVNEFADHFGEGETEISVKGIHNGNPEYSITTIQPLMQSEDRSDNLLIQGGLHSSETTPNDRRTTLNLGLVKRYMLDDNRAIAGGNLFIDREMDSDQMRASIGGEYHRSNFGFDANLYKVLGSHTKNVNGTDEKAQDGFDLNVEGQAPYLLWARIKSTYYKWQGIDSGDINGHTLGVEIGLHPAVMLELGTEDSNTMNRANYGQLTIKFPIEGRKHTHHFVDTVAWREGRDMQDQLMQIVSRNNKIVVESSASSVIHNGLTYNIITSTTGKKWLDRNLGATEVCTTTTTANCYGDTYQWGREADGHQVRTSGTTTT